MNRIIKYAIPLNKSTHFFKMVKKFSTVGDISFLLSPHNKKFKTLIFLTIFLSMKDYMQAKVSIDGSIL